MAVPLVLVPLTEVIKAITCDAADGSLGVAVPARESVGEALCFHPGRVSWAINWRAGFAVGLIRTVLTLGMTYTWQVNGTSTDSRCTNWWKEN